jgi:hypothetical protein
MGGVLFNVGMTGTWVDRYIGIASRIDKTPSCHLLDDMFEIVEK